MSYTSLDLFFYCYCTKLYYNKLNKRYEIMEITYARRDTKEANKRGKKEENVKKTFITVCFRVHWNARNEFLHANVCTSYYANTQSDDDNKSSNNNKRLPMKQNSRMKKTQANDVESTRRNTSNICNNNSSNGISSAVPAFAV